jgi:hypothetical protein
MAKSAKTPATSGEAAGSPEAESPEAESPGAKSTDAELAPDAEAGPGTEPGTATAPADDLDETKRKFREALDRKKQAHASDTAAAGNRAAGKAHGAGGPATSRRQFRRKSG